MFLSFIVLNFSTYVNAATDVRNTENEYKSAFADDEFQTKMDQAMDKASFIDRVFFSIANGFFKLSGVAPLNELIFGNPYAYWGINDTSGLQYGIFTQREIDILITPLTGALIGAYITFATLAILISTLKMGMRPHSPQATSDFWKDLQMWVLSALFASAFWPMFTILSDFNTAIVMTVQNVLNNTQGISVDGLSILADVEDGWQIGDLVLMLGEWVLGVILNFIYISRKLVIILLVLCVPLVAYSLLFAKTRSFFGLWFKELCGNIFMQSIHAMVLYTLAVLASLGTNAIIKLLLLCLFIPVSGMLSKWLNLGDSSSRAGNVLGMAGLSSVAGAMMLARGAGGLMKGRGGSSPSVGSGSSGSITGPINGGSDYGNTSISSAASKNSTGFGKVTQGLKKGATIAGATVGALGGMVAGPGGAALGGAVGAKIGGSMVQGATNLGGSIVNTSKSLGQLGSFAKSGDWNTNLNERRRLMGNVGESIGSAFGEKGGAAGRAVGNFASGATRRRIQTEQFQGRTPAEIAKMNPGASVYLKGDADKSAFYMRNKEGQEEIISNYGQGFEGATNPVIIPYSTPSIGSSVKQSANGTYVASQAGNFAPTATTGMRGSAASQAGIPIPTTVMRGSTPSILRAGNANAQGTNGHVNQSANGSSAASQAGIPLPTTVMRGSTSSNLRTSEVNTQGTNGNINQSANGSYVASQAGYSAPTETGMKGSTLSFLRTGDAYTQDSNGNKYQYSGVDASKINPDQYFSHSAEGQKTGTGVGRKYDQFRGTRTVTEQRKEQTYNKKLEGIAGAYKQEKSGRKRGII